MMNETTITNALESEFPGASIDIQLEGSHCQITVVSEIFEGLRPVARQQKVYAPLNEFIRSGELHAVNIIAKTP